MPLIEGHRFLGSNASTVKSHNLRTALMMLLRHEHISRVRLAKLTGLSTTTITNLISELLAQELVAEDVRAPKKRGIGRPPTLLRLVPDAQFAVGVHIGVGNIRIAVTDLRAHPLAGLTLAHSLDRSPEEVLDEAAARVEEVLRQSGVDRARVVGVGVGASGLVNPHTGVNVLAPNLGWRDVPIRDWVARRLGLPVRVDNNARAMALGEAMFGGGRDVYSLAFVYARIGVGAGFVVGGQLYRGSAAGAGEIGHTTLVADNGEPCRCGNTGCLETLVSEPAIVRLAVEQSSRDEKSIVAFHLRGGQGSPIDRVFAAARAGDAQTLAMLHERARYMGIALANLINVLNPDLIVLGGIYAQGADLLLPAIEATMRAQASAGLGDRVRLQTTSLGRDAGVIGAAALALNYYFYQQEPMLPPTEPAQRELGPREGWL